MNYDKVGNFIKEKRKEKNLTQKELAEKINVTDKAISKWERGQGCPDVSILEVLSKELGCSILELLKGREIENEVIPITEADDYVRDSMQLSSEITRNKIYSMINKIIVTSIIVIALLLVYLNVVQIIYSTKKYTNEDDFHFYKNFKENMDFLENNLDVIKSNQGKFSNEDHEYIVYELDNMISSIKNRKLYSYIIDRKDIIYTVNDLYVFIEGEGLIINSESPLIRRLMEYDDSDYMRDYFKTINAGWIISASASNYGTLAALTSYQYKLNPYADIHTMFYDNHRELRSLLYNMKDDVLEVLYLTDVIMKVGEINE